tara:strand:+ start:481 stop:1020 length:540 start_codon:yes stop_codon:yes gene_type:complete
MKNYIPFLLLTLFLFSCRSGAQVPEDTVIKVMTPTPVPIDCKNEFYPNDAPQLGDNEALGYKKINNDLKMVTIVEGEGEKQVEPNDKVDVDYTGWLVDGCIFDSTYPRGSSAKFRIGTGQVIKGWDVGIEGMKEGEVRRLNIGYNFAYGEEGIPGVIPEKSTLIFEVKLNKIIRLVNNE